MPRNTQTRILENARALSTLKVIPGSDTVFTGRKVE